MFKNVCFKFQNSHLSLAKLLMLLYLFCMDVPIHTAERMVQCAHVTVIDWYNFYRDICTKALISLKWKLGENQIVEIDESVFAKKRKYGKGEMPCHQQWIFGMVERNTKRSAFKLVQRRTKEELWPILQENVVAGSTIYHDEYSTYKKLDSIGYKHASVNHSKEFKPKDGVCTNTIEGLWGLVKNKIKVMHGIRQDRLDAYLDEFSYRHYYGLSGDIFWIVLYHISVFYPLGDANEAEVIETEF